jgi:hypothetical protein
MLYPAELRVRLAVHFADWPRLGQRPLGASSLAWRCGPASKLKTVLTRRGTLLNVSTKELENGTGRRRIHDWAHRE